MTQNADFDGTLRSLMSDADLRGADAAADFAGDVVVRIKRRRRLRTVALAIAGGAGLAISAAGLGGIVQQIAGVAGQALAPAASDPGALAYMPFAAAFIALAVLWRRPLTSLF